MSFADRLRTLASEAAIYGISSVVGRLITFLLFPFYSQFFTPDEYGVVGVVFTLFVFANVVYQYGMESAYLKFASDATGLRKTEVLSTSTWALLFSSVLLSALLLVGKPVVAGVIGLAGEWHHLLDYVAAILILDTLAVVPFAKLRLENRPMVFAAVRISAVVLNVALNVYLIAFRGMGIEAVFIANVASSALALVMLVPTFVGGLRLVLDRSLLRTLLGFGLPFLPAGLGYAFADRVNIFFLNAMPRERVLALYGADIDPAMLMALQTPADYGEYVAGVFNGVAKLAVIMALVVQMFRYAWQPFFLQHARDPDARPLFARVFTLFVAASLVVVLAVSFFAQELVAIPLPGGRHLVQARFWIGLFAVPVLLLGYLFQGMYYNFAAGAYIERKTGYFVYCALAGGAVSILANILFVPRFGMIAAAWSVASAYFVMAVLLYVFMRRHYPVPYDWKRIAGLGVCAMVVFGLWYRVPFLHQPLGEFLLLAAFVGTIIGLRIVRPRSIGLLFARGRAGGTPRDT